jgi:carbamoyl-phosphate synthase small subunit
MMNQAHILHPASRPVKLILEDGTEWQGWSFGSETPMAGEVVFNTAMAGYPESITDASYRGQILVLTYPLIGNYGVPGKQREHGMLQFFESEDIHISGLIISDYSFDFSHWNAHQSLADWLRESNIPGIYGIDTRTLTKHLREEGAMLGKIVFDEDIPFVNPNLINLVDQVSTREIIRYGSGKYKILLIDCGVKNNIIRCLLRRDTEVIRVPWDADIQSIGHDGLFISNGPGDPKQCAITIENIRQSLQGDKPIFGICLGNQLMGLAAGGDTYKLKYGHRSHNQPVIQIGTDKSYITSQNHGFALDDSTLPEGWEPLFRNLNDQTNEGIRHKTKPFFSSQFHPEASSGPTDTEFLFDEFIEKIKNSKN